MLVFDGRYNAYVLMLGEDVEGDVDSASRNAARSEWWNQEGNNIERITYDNVSDPLSQKYRPSRNLFDLHLNEKKFSLKKKRFVKRLVSRSVNISVIT